MDLRRVAYEMLERRSEPTATASQSRRSSDVGSSSRLSRSTVNCDGSIFTLEGDYVEEILDVVSVSPRHGPWATARCLWVASVKALIAGET
eukprot:341889-Prymnesium_polylepis.1